MMDKQVVASFLSEARTRTAFLDTLFARLGFPSPPRTVPAPTPDYIQRGFLPFKITRPEEKIAGTYDDAPSRVTAKFEIPDRRERAGALGSLPPTASGRPLYVSDSVEKSPEAISLNPRAQFTAPDAPRPAAIAGNVPNPGIVLDKFA